MSAIHEGQRVRSVCSGRTGTVEYLGRIKGPDAFALVRWDDGRTAAAGLGYLVPAVPLSGDPAGVPCPDPDHDLSDNDDPDQACGCCEGAGVVSRTVAAQFIRRRRVSA